MGTTLLQPGPRDIPGLVRGCLGGDPLCHNGGGNAQDTDDGAVHEPGLRGAGAMEPGLKAP